MDTAEVGGMKIKAVGRVRRDKDAGTVCSAMAAERLPGLAEEMRGGGMAVLVLKVE